MSPKFPRWRPNNRHNRDPLHYSALLGDNDEVLSLIEAGANVSAADINGYTPLHFAALEHRTETARLLLSNGADPNLPDVHGNTPLWVAAMNTFGRFDLVTLLLQSGADPHYKNIYGRTPHELANEIAHGLEDAFETALASPGAVAEFGNVRPSAMWTPQTVTKRIASRSLLPDFMFESLDADSLLDIRDDSFEDDWVRAAEPVQAAWDRYPGAESAAQAIDVVREAVFKRVFDASGGNHDLAAAVSDDFELICRRALLGVGEPFITSLEQAYDSHRIPH